MGMLEPQQRQTYRILAPVATHWRSATCEEVECGLFADGWRLRKELVNERDLDFIKRSRRQFIELDLSEGEIWLVFAPGTPCLLQWATGLPFTERHHKLPTGRPEFYTVQPGDFRMRCGEARVFDRGDQWVDDFACHQDRILERGKRLGVWDG